jgi:hypothetical protein
MPAIAGERRLKMEENITIMTAERASLAEHETMYISLYRTGGYWYCLGNLYKTTEEATKAFFGYTCKDKRIVCVTLPIE